MYTQQKQKHHFPKICAHHKNTILSLHKTWIEISVSRILSQCPSLCKEHNTYITLKCKTKKTPHFRKRLSRMIIMNIFISRISDNLFRSCTNVFRRLQCARIFLKCRDLFLIKPCGCHAVILKISTFSCIQNLANRHSSWGTQELIHLDRVRRLLNIFIVHFNRFL